MKLGMLCYYDDNQHKEDENDQQIPIVEKDLPDHTKRHLIGMEKHLDEVDGEVFPEETEANDVQEIQEDGCGIGDDLKDVNEGLQFLVIDDARGQAIENDV